MPPAAATTTGPVVGARDHARLFCACSAVCSSPCVEPPTPHTSHLAPHTGGGGGGVFADGEGGGVAPAPAAELSRAGARGRLPADEHPGRAPPHRSVGWPAQPRRPCPSLAHSLAAKASPTPPPSPPPPPRIHTREYDAANIKRRAAAAAVAPIAAGTKLLDGPLLRNVKHEDATWDVEEAEGEEDLSGGGGEQEARILELTLQKAVQSETGEKKERWACVVVGHPLIDVNVAGEGRHSSVLGC